MPFDAEIFDEMKNTALEILAGKEKKDYAQAIVLRTAGKNKYAAFIENALSAEKAEENALLERLIFAKDTEIEYILCLWQSREMDIPSHDLRKMIAKLNEKNSDSEIFVLTGSGISAIKLERTMR